MGRTLLAAAASLGALVLASTPASAADIIFNLDNVTFVDGGTLTGWFSTSEDLSVLTGFSFTSSANHAWPYGNFTGDTYTLAGASNHTWNPVIGIWAVFGDPATAQINFFFDGGLNPTGGALDATTSEWVSTSGSRHLMGAVNGGPGPSVSVAAVPEPATWALMIGGFALVGASMRRRNVAVSFA